MSNDDLDHIPSIVPTRDEAPQRNSGKLKSDGSDRGRSSKLKKQPPSQGESRGTGVLTLAFLFIALLVAVLACAWSWQLQNQLQEATDQMADYAVRIGDLEARLSDTDEGMNQSAAVQAVKIAELETEVRKLWDNVWKETKDRLGKLEAASASQGKSIKGVEGSMSNAQSQLKAAAADIAKLKSVGGDLARLMSSAKANQAEVERVADSLNQVNLSLAKLDKRVAGNEEWVRAVNVFRAQVNTSLRELQGTVRTLQAAP
jgi:chromosome segregation ATPase